MLLMLSMRFAATIHYYLWAYAPTNILLRRLRTRDGLKWAMPTALVLAPTYLFIAAIATSVLDDDGPGWLNLVVLTCIWNAFKVGGVGLLSLPMLLSRRLGSGNAAQRRPGPSERLQHAGSISVQLPPR